MYEYDPFDARPPRCTYENVRVLVLDAEGQLDFSDKTVHVQITPGGITIWTDEKTIEKQLLLAETGFYEDVLEMLTEHKRCCGGITEEVQ